MSKDTVIQSNEYNKFNNGRTTYTFTNFTGINVFTKQTITQTTTNTGSLEMEV